MLVSEVVYTNKILLTIGDSFAQASDLMKKLQVNSLPVVDASTNEIVGQISSNNLEADDERLISQHDLEDPVVIFNNQHLFEAVRTMLEHEMDLLPVVDEESSYFGTIQKKQLLGLLVTMLNLTGRGSVITIVLSPIDFSLSEIVQLIEGEGGKLWVSPWRNHMVTMITTRYLSN